MTSSCRQRFHISLRVRAASLAVLSFCAFGPGSGAGHPGQGLGEFNYNFLQDLGGWAKAQKAHFADGGLFDKFYQP